jgi:hypothetical protein
MHQQHRHDLHLPCLQGPTGTSTPAKLIAAAFPALQRLELLQVSLKWTDLHALTSCSQLSCLRVDNCAFPATAPAINPLAALASLRELHALQTNSFIAQGLTQLTSLCLHSETDTLSQLIMHRLGGMPQLQQLDLGSTDNHVPAAMVAQLFSALPHLTGLSLYNIIRQQAFDALLAHATQLTRFTCLGLDLLHDRSQSACSWKELVVTGYSCLARTLAHLPLHSLSRVHLYTLDRWEQFEIPSACPCLRYYSLSSTPAQLQAALTNLGACPAWQHSGPSVCVTVTSHGHEQTVELIPALAALASREVQLAIDAARLSMTADIVERLGATLGHSISNLRLLRCSIPHDFWPAVWRHLPELQELSLMRGAGGAVSCNDIAAFCSHATRPLSLRLGPYLYSQLGPAEQLEQQCRTWGVPQVTLIKDGEDP